MYYQHVKLIMLQEKASINATYLIYYHKVTHTLPSYRTENPK